MGTYRNIKTGILIETHGKIHGEDWQEEKAPATSPVKEATKKKAVKKQ